MIICPVRGPSHRELWGSPRRVQTGGTLSTGGFNPGPATLRHHDAVLGVLRRAGFTLPMAAHAVSLIDSYIGGYVLQEANLPIETPEQLHDVTSGILEDPPTEAMPYLTEMIVDHTLQPHYDTSEFAYGLDLILDALEHRRR
jgi:hypothetical protein